MLKIKDNIDLKELEKFGFKKRNGDFLYVFNWGRYEIGMGIFKDRNIQLSCGEFADTDIFIPIKIYDLIQAGLVEKVEEDKPC